MPVTLILAALLNVAALPEADSTPKFVPPTTIPELEARIQKVLDSAKVAGIGLTIVRHDSIVYLGGLGRARVSPAVKATDATLFRIGSTSKAFVALTAQALVREGKLSLDTPLAKALPGFYFKNQWEATDPVRIVNLLEHTSGFDDNSLHAYAINDSTTRPVEAGLALDSATRVSRWRPGTRFSYCNTGPAIVALIIEKIEGKPFEQVVQERWFDPIGMKTATYLRPDSTKLNVATLYRDDGTTPVPYWYVFIRPAGSINASPRDMAAYVRFLLGRGTIDGRELLPRESIERMERSESSLGSRAGLTVGYGLHLYRTADSTGYTWTGHGGAVEGGLSDVSFMPAYNVGYSFQINSGNHAAYDAIARLVRAYVTHSLAPPAPPATVAVAAATRERFAGWYRSVSPRAQHLYPLERLTSLLRVSFTDSTMRLKPVLGAASVFVAVDSVRFRRPGEPRATLAFVRDDANGRGEGIEQFSTKLGMAAARVPSIDALGVSVLAVLWMLGVCLSFVAMAFGALRSMVRRIRHRPPAVTATAAPWRVAAVVALIIATHFVFFIGGSSDVRAMGTLTSLSGTIWAAGILFGLAALVGAVIAWRTRTVDGRWERLSLWTVRGVATLDVIVAAYLTYWGWIGWKTWA
jgi:CubicO group peptidase (beta-lactamase class C family)